MDPRDEEPGALAAAALRRVARDESVKEYVLRNRPLRDALFRAARRFVGGETLSECAGAAADLNREGFAATMDFMGESTRDEGLAAEATTEFLRVVEMMAARGLDSSASLDLSHVGLTVEGNLAGPPCLVSP